MKYYKIVFIVLACTVLVPVAGFAGEEEEIGTVLVAEGDVKILPEGKAPGKAARVDDVLRLKDIVKTGEGASAKVMLRNDEVVVIAASTEIDLSQYLPEKVEEGAKEEHVIKLNRGKLRIMVKEGYGEQYDLKVKTSNAFAGVIGTDFVIEFIPEEDTTRVSVLSGTVQVGHAWLPGVQVLGPGQFTEIVGEKAPFVPEPFGTDEEEKLKSLMVKRPPLPVLQIAPAGLRGLAGAGGPASSGGPAGFVSQPENVAAPQYSVRPLSQPVAEHRVPEIVPDVGPVGSANVPKPPPKPPPPAAPPPPPPPPPIPGQR